MNFVELSQCLARILVPLYLFGFFYFFIMLMYQEAVERREFVMWAKSNKDKLESPLTFAGELKKFIAALLISFVIALFWVGWIFLILLNHFEEKKDE